MSQIKTDTLDKYKNKRVFVGLSGGVDSSVALLYLVNAGAYVTGVFIKGWYPPEFPCSWREDRRDAMRVCAYLNIPFIECNAEKEYKDEVIDYLISEYKIGRTPNPDIMCNRHIKFGSFFDFAMSKGADYIATGHYVRSVRLGNTVRIYEAKDKEKDQSYFLWAVPKEKLKKSIFPLGQMFKKDVRAIAARAHLDTAHKKDSQGICFLGNLSIKDFLKKYIKTEEGNVLNESGEIIGRHPGSLMFTIGERHGFTVSVNKTNTKPLFVVKKDITNNTLTVSEIRPRIGKSRGIIILDKLNLINKIPKNGLSVRLQYRQDKIPCEQIFDDSSFKISIPHDSPMPVVGQSAVLYCDEECLGGGIVAEIK